MNAEEVFNTARLEAFKCKKAWESHDRTDDSMFNARKSYLKAEGELVTFLRKRAGL